MSIITIVKSIGRGVIATILLSAVFQQTALAGEGALLGIQPNYPQINFTGTTGQGCTYDADALGAGMGQLTITGTPTLLLLGPLPTGPFGGISGGLVTMVLDIDSAGALSGGSFTVNGSTTVSAVNYTDPLLTGTFTAGDYGIVDVNPLSTTDLGDVVAVFTGGSLAPFYTNPANDIGATLTLETSNYVGTMTADWLCLRAKGVIGPVPAVVVPTEGACSQGYWKNHKESWPVDNLDLGNMNYSMNALVALLKAKPKGDKSIILAKQLIAAKLNVAGGSDPSCIQSTIDAADAWIIQYAASGLPGNVSSWNDGQDLKDDLDAYNNGESSCANYCTR